MMRGSAGIAAGKRWNAGQTCVAPDYMFLPKGKTAEFIEHFQSFVEEMYPDILHNPRLHLDY